MEYKMIKKTNIVKEESRLAVLPKHYWESLRKLIADEALPIEIRPSLCTAICAEDCAHKNYIEVWTWIPIRYLELSNKVGEHVGLFLRGEPQEKRC